MADRLESWFKSQVLVHEDLFMRFLARAWPNRDDLMDLRQETYARICEAAQQDPPQSPKAFLFAVARHIMSDRRRRERVVSIQAAGDHDFSNDLVEEKTPERYVGANQELVRLAQAFDRLPARCREVIWMRRVLDLSQKEIAARLKIGEKAVEKQIVRGGRLLARFLLQPTEPEAGGEPPRIGDIVFGDKNVEEDQL
jgi:RNA polymerase sigma factor (sigma-70 family)